MMILRLARLLAVFLCLALPAPLFAAFGLTTATDFYTVDTGANLVFKVRRTDNGSSTQSAGDIMSLVYNGVEYQNTSRGSQITSGFDFLYTGVSAVTVSATVINTDYIRITVVAGNLTHYYMARNGQPHIYMATYFTTEPDIHGLCRYIVRIPEAKLPNGPVPSDIRNNTGSIESADIFGMADGTTRSKHYSNMRLKDWSYIGATGTNVGVWMLRSNHEGDSGGPFYRSLLNQCGGDQEITYIINYGEAQTEPFRTNILNGPYVLAFNNGAAPTAPDTSWVANMGLTGYVGASGRGTVSGTAITGRDTTQAYTVGFANTTAQYWTDAAAENGAFNMAGMLPGTYTMKVYKKELAVYTSSVTVSAGGTTALGSLAINADPSTTLPLWRVGNWDGTPQEFLNGDKITTMHPSDVRMASWNPGTYVVGTSTLATGIPSYQWKDVNGSQAIQFQLTAAQVVASTIRVGLTAAYEGARPKISVNSWTYPSNPAASTQPETRTLTVGTYRGNNVTYTFAVPASALVAGTNTLYVFPISGSGATGFLSAGYSLDCIEMSQGAAQIVAVPAAPAGLTATAVGGNVLLDWPAVSGATSYQVKRGTTPGGPYVTLGETVTDNFTDTTAGGGKTFYYVVHGSNSSGTGLSSPEASVTRPGPLVHLRFDEAAGTIAADASGNGQNGTLAGGATFVAGKIGNAGNLSGSSQHVTLPVGIAGGLNDFTIAAWVKVSAFSTWARVFDFGTGSTNYLFLAPQYNANAPNTSKMRFAIRTPSTAEQTIDSSVAISTNTWVHVAVTLNGTTGRLYLNGAQVGSNPAMTLKPADLGNTTLNYLGRSQFATDPYLNGALDDFRIYGRALPAAEITDLSNRRPAAPLSLTGKPDDGKAILTWAAENEATSYNVKRSGTAGGPYTPVATGVTQTNFTNTGLTNGQTWYYVVSSSNAQGEGPDSPETAVTPGTLRLHLKLDESTGPLAADSSGRGLDASTVNGPPWQAGKWDNALRLNAASSQFINLPKEATGGLTNFTVMGWVKFATVTTFARVFDFGGSTEPGATTGSYMFLAPTGANGIRFAITSSGYTNEQQITANVAVPANTWMHLAVTLSGTTGRIYLNGSLAATNNAMTLNPAALGALTRNYIGKSIFAADPYLDAWVDDFRIYSRAIGATELAGFQALPAITSAATSAALVGNPFFYQITASNSPAAFDATALPAGLTVDTATGLISGTPSATGTFNATIQATNVMGTGSAPLAITISPNPPAIPTGLTATGGSGSISLAWNASAGATSYTVSRSATSGGTFTPLPAGSVTGTTFTDMNLPDGATYYYAVSSTGPGGTSGNSAEASASTFTTLENWRMEFFGTIDNLSDAADNADPDHDGTLNQTEFRLGLDPLDPLSTFRASGEMTPSGFKITWPFASGLVFEIRRTLVPAAAEEVVATVTGAGTFTAPADPSGTAIYRVALLP